MMETQRDGLEKRLRWKGRAFTLIEVMLAMSIVALAMTFTYEAFYTVRRLNARGRFYSSCLDLVRDKLGAQFALRSLGTGVIDEGEHGSTGLRYRLEHKGVAGAPRLRLVVLTVRSSDDRLGAQRELVFRSYLFDGIECRGGEEDGDGS